MIPGAVPLLSNDTNWILHICESNGNNNKFRVHVESVSTNENKLTTPELSTIATGEEPGVIA